MNTKWMCGFAALAFFTSLAMGQTKPISNFGADTETARKQALGEYWSAYTVSPKTDEPTTITNAGTPGNYVAIVQDGNDWVVAIEGYTLGGIVSVPGNPDPCSWAGNPDGIPTCISWPYESYPQAAIGVNVGTGYNLSGCTGFTYQFKGAKHLFKAELSTVTPDDGNAHFKLINASAGWTPVTVNNTEMVQDQNAKETASFNSGSIAKFAFEVSSKPDQPGSANTGELYVKDFACTGSYTEPAPGSSSSGDPGSSSSGGTPILSNGVTITGLNVAHFARNLHIASGKDATVSLFDMHGKQVFSKKVLAGESVVSLENQRQGVYYAVVRSGSLKQTVKVVLK